MGAWMPLSYLVPVIPELPILRFTSLAVELLFSYCSADFPLPLVSLYFYWCGREGDIFTTYFGLHQLSLCVWDVCLTKILSQTKLSWTILSFHVLFKLHKMSDKHCTSNSRSTNMKFLTYLVFGHPNWIFLLFLNFVYYPWVPIVQGARRDYSWNNNVECKAVFTLYQIDFRTATRSHPVPYEHSTLEIGAAQLRSVRETTPKSPFLYVNRSPSRYSFRAGAKAVQYSVNTA